MELKKELKKKKRRNGHKRNVPAGLISCAMNYRNVEVTSMMSGRRRRQEKNSG
jgi:hypothetical protein